jgi:ATP-dependent helicase/DNAse subunit B
MAPRPLIIPVRELRKLEVETDAERRPSAPHTSYSQFSMYNRCSMQYFYRYIVGLKEKPKVSLSIGKGGHAALEWNTKHKLLAGTDQPAEAVVQKASDMMDFYMTEMPPSEYEADVEPGALKDKFLAATRIYAVRDAPKIIPVGAEVEYNLDINKYVPLPLAEKLHAPIRPVNMKLDVIEKDTTTLVQHHGEGVAVNITDYKYVQRKMTQASVNMSPQITTYLTALHDITGKWASKAGIRMMHPGSLAKNPKPDADVPDSIPLMREPSEMTPEALERRMTRVATQFAQTERGIKEEIWIATDDPITCSWCGFRDRCQSSLVDDFGAARIREVTDPR